MKRILTLILVVPFVFGLAGLEAHSTDIAAWQAVTGPTGGSVAALVISPNYAYDHTVYAGVRGRGVYRTDDGGLSWQSTSSGSRDIIDVAISPAYPADQTVFAATADTVYRSTNAGSAWQTPALTPSPDGLQNLTDLIVSPNYAADHTLYAIGASATYRSTDGGVTFTLAGGWFATHLLTDLAFSPNFATDHTLFASVQAGGVYKSVDGGTVWNPTSLADHASVIAISPNYIADQTLAAISIDDGHIYISDNSGASWSPSTITLSGSVNQHTLLFSPTFATDHIMLAASAADPGAYWSDDEGANWSPVGWYAPLQSYLGGFVGGSVFALALAPHTSPDGAAFAGTSSGIYHSSDWGEHWYQRNAGMARLTVRALAVAPDDSSTLLAGTAFFERAFDGISAENDGSLQLSTDGGATWRDVSGRLDQVQAVAFSPNFASDQTAFATTGLVASGVVHSGGVYRSTDGGQNWDLVSSGLACWALAISPDFAVDNTLWVYASSETQGAGIFVSTDGGDSWAPLTTAVQATSMEPSPNYAVDQTIFAGTNDDGVQKSTNGGQNWTSVLSYTTTALAVSPAYAASRTLYAGIHETVGGPGAIYRSTDGGATWQLLNTGIPVTSNGNALTIAVLRFASDGSVLAGVSYGAVGGAVYRSEDGGQTWALLAGGLNAYRLFDIASGSAEGAVKPHAPMSFYAGTDSGLWQFQVTQFDPAEPGTWASTGPRGGRAQALAVSPAFVSDGVAFSGEWLMGRAGDQLGQGIFKSTDWGATWQPSSSGTEHAPFPYSSAIHAFAFSPNFTIDKTVFAATWSGLFKSTDRGATWKWLTRAYFGAPGSFGSVAVAPNYATSGVVIAGGGWGGLFVSRDGGLNWTPNYSVTYASAIAYSPQFATSQTAFIAGDSLYKTTNGGLSWTRMITTPLSSVALSPLFSSDHTMYAGGAGVYISSNEGESWISRTIAPSVTMVSALAISPAFNADHTLFAGTNIGLYRSTDGGLFWSPMPGYSGAPVVSLAISPGWPNHNVLLVGTARGVERITNGVSTLAQGQAPLQVQPIALSSDETLWVAGTSNHGVYASTNGGSSWLPIGFQDGAFLYSIHDVAVSPAYTSDQTLFAAWSSGVSIGGSVYRSTNGGATWQPVYSTDNVDSLAISPQFATDHTVYANGNTGRVVRSIDGGDTWDQIATWPPGTFYPARQVAVPPSYPTDSTIFAGGAQGFWRLPPSATAWQPAASGLISNTAVIAFAVSPNYTSSQTLLAIASWMPGGVTHHGLFRSTDGGVNWLSSDIGLPDVELRGVAFSPDYGTDNTAYAISASQLYRSIDGGLSWTALGAPPGSPALSDLAVTRTGHVIVTSSAGVWRYSTLFRDILVDGGFAAGSGWDTPTTLSPAGYSDRVEYEGSQSLRLGIDNGSNVNADSSAQQTVTIPISATVADLSLRMYTVSSEANMAPPNQAGPQGGTAVGDAQYLLILDPDTGATLETLVWTLSNDQTWQRYKFDLSPYAGQSIVLHLGVYNDGVGGRTAMYVDNASLVIGAVRRSYLPITIRSQ